MCKIKERAKTVKEQKGKKRSATQIGGAVYFLPFFSFEYNLP
jgi:hypothetical protein